MPTYDYECQSCGHAFELFQSMTEKVRRKCPACGKPALKRLIGPGAGILFKGEGFYSTDYRSDSYKRGQKSAGDGDAAVAPSGKDAGGGKADTGGDRQDAGGGKADTGGDRKDAGGGKTDAGGDRKPSSKPRRSKSASASDAVAHKRSAR